MKPDRFILFLILVFGLLLVHGCNQLTGSESDGLASSPNLADGETIAQADDQHLSEEQRTLYRRDAEILSVRYINEKDSTQTGIPETLINTLYNGLIHIVNSTHPKAEEVTQTYTVHARNPGPPREVLVFADSTAPWVDTWRNRITKTGNPEIDDLIDRFDFTLIAYNELANTLPTVMTTLRSSRALNVFAVGRLFQQLDEIDQAHPNFLLGDGNEIRVLFFDDHLRYTFEYGFGDCPAGCISRHIWKLKVYRDGSVEFLGEEGDPLPDG